MKQIMHTQKQVRAMLEMLAKQFDAHSKACRTQAKRTDDDEEQDEYYARSSAYSYAATITRAKARDI